MKVLRLQDILTAPNRLNAAAHRANWNAFKAHNRTRGWLKEQTVCQQWALAITVSFATSCPHSLWVSQLCPLALLISQTAEFGFQEKKKNKKKTAVTFCRAQGRGAEARTWMGGEKNGTWPNYMIRAENQERLRPGDSHRNSRGTLTWM